MWGSKKRWWYFLLHKTISHHKHSHTVTTSHQQIRRRNHAAAAATTAAILTYNEEESTQICNNDAQRKIMKAKYNGFSKKTHSTLSKINFMRAPPRRFHAHFFLAHLALKSSLCLGRQKHEMQKGVCVDITWAHFFSWGKKCHQSSYISHILLLYYHGSCIPPGLS